jgi:hypothetical protein
MRQLMMFASALLIGVPLSGQSRVITNADLGKPLPRIATITPEQLLDLAEHQFRYVPPLPNGPQVVGVWSSPTAGPFGEFPRYQTRRFDSLGWFDYSRSVTPYWAYPYGGRIVSPSHADRGGRSHINRPTGRR